MLRDWLHPRVSEGVKLVLKPHCDSEIFLARELEIAKRIDQSARDSRVGDWREVGVRRG